MLSLPEGFMIEIVGDKLRLKIGDDDQGYITATCTLAECDQLCSAVQYNAGLIRSEKRRLADIVNNQLRSGTGMRLRCRGKAA